MVGHNTQHATKLFLGKGEEEGGEGRKLVADKTTDGLKML